MLFYNVTSLTVIWLFML